MILHTLMPIKYIERFMSVSVESPAIRVSNMMRDVAFLECAVLAVSFLATKVDAAVSNIKPDLLASFVFLSAHAMMGSGVKKVLYGVPNDTRIRILVGLCFIPITLSITNYFATIGNIKSLSLKEAVVIWTTANALIKGGVFLLDNIMPSKY